MHGHRRSRGALLTLLGAAFLAGGALVGPPLSSPVRADHGCAYIIRPATGPAGTTFQIWSSYFLKRLTFSRDGEVVRVVELDRVPKEYFFETTSRDAGRWDIHAESTGCEKNLKLLVTLPGTSTETAGVPSRGSEGVAEDRGLVSLMLLFLGTALLMLRRPLSLRRARPGV